MNRTNNKHLAQYLAHAALAVSSLCVFSHGHFAWLVPVAAFLLAVLGRVAHSAWRRPDAVFAADPLAPDFKGLAKDLAGRITLAAAGGRRQCVVLSPLFDAKGCFVPYSVSWEPKDRHLVVFGLGQATRRKVDANLKVCCRLPVDVVDEPVSLVFDGRGAAGGSAAATLSVSPRLRRADAPFGKTAWIAYEFYVAALLACAVFVGGPVFRNLHVFLLAALPVVFHQVCLFIPGFGRWLYDNILFLFRLCNRFFPDKNRLDRRMASLDKTRRCCRWLFRWLP